jgi:oligosaccharide repeat unit polymerase
MLTLDWIMLVGCTAWTLWQYRRTKILLTPSNAFMVSGIILPVFVSYNLALSPESLLAIGMAGHALHMQWAADELLGVICVGTICVLLGHWAAPRLFPRLAGKRRELPRSPRVSLSQLTLGACVVCLVGVASVWIFLIKEGEIPLLSSAQHARELLQLGHPLRYIYTGGFILANIGAVFLMGGLFLGKIIGQYRPLCFFAITAITITNLATASRGNLLAPFLSAGLIYFSLKNTKLTPFRASIWAVLLLLSASALALIRSHIGITLAYLWYEVIHGNTFFANFRDSSFVLMAFEGNRYPLFHAWGVVTLNIVHITSPLHFGLGQVLFADWYLNFGIAGVALEGLVIGVALKWLDVRLFDVRRPPKGAVSDQYFQLFGIWFRWGILGSLCSSASVMLVYPQLLGYMLILAVAYGARQIFGMRPGVGGGMRQPGMSATLEPPRHLAGP